MRARCLSNLVLCILNLTYRSASARPVDANSSTSAPQVDLGYANYEGTTTAAGINRFLGMRFAAPPTGSRRFRLPEDPLQEDGLIKAQQRGPACLGVSNPSLLNPTYAYGEDCLFIDVYTPANVSSGKESGLPVMLWIQGGGYVQDYNANYDGTGLIEASGGNVIVATFNYRVGPYGFLASEELKTEGNLNVGLHDQRAAISWIHNHISAFGGDPEQVTLFGASVGGGSVLLQLLAYGGNPPTNTTAQWSAGIAESMFLPSVWTVDEMEFQYQQLLQATNCTTLDCLRRLPVDQLQTANVAIPFPSQEQTALFGYGPVIDGGLLPDRLSNLLKQGRFAKDKPLIVGSSNTEGTLFAPQANNTAEVNQFMTAQLPGLTNSTLQRLESLYSDVPATFPGVNVSEAPFYYRAAEMFGDSSLICPAFNFAAGLSSAGVPVHLYLDRIRDPAEVAAGYITPHTWDIQAVWGPSYATNYVALSAATSYEPGQSNAAIVPVVQGYWTSFAMSSGNPNVFKAGRAPSWEETRNGSFLSIQTNATRMEQISKDLATKCSFWATLGDETSQ